MKNDEKSSQARVPETSGDQKEKELLEQPAPGASGKPEVEVAPNLVTACSARAANESSIDGGATSASGMPLSQLAKTFRAAIDRPTDSPNSTLADQGQLLALRALALHNVVPDDFVSDIENAVAANPIVQAPGATVVPMAMRVGAHLLYVLAAEIGTRNEAGLSIDSTLLAVFGGWIVRGMLDNWRPSTSTIARLRSALIRPDGRAARGWTDSGRQRALTSAIRLMNKAIISHATAARSFGLSPPSEIKLLSSDPLYIFNRAFRRRVNNLTNFASKNNVAGATGYGALSANGLRSVGQRLRGRVCAMQARATHICLLVITHMPSKTMLKMPVVKSGAPPAEALAWIDVDGQTFNYYLFHLTERGARPLEDAKGCYEYTQQLVSIPLPSFLTDSLRFHWDKAEGPVTTIVDLLGEIYLHPCVSLGGGKGYKITVRRIQESVPAHLLTAGLHRWPVALATNSQFLLSRGRPAYGICSSSLVVEAVNHGYKLLGWPHVPTASSDILIGSFVTPTPTAVTAALNGLAARADRLVSSGPEYQALVEELNSHAAWLAAVLALGLALRTSVTYSVIQSELVRGVAAHVDDKHVHAHQGPPVPIADFLRKMILLWQIYCGQMVTRLRAAGDARSSELALMITSRIGDGRHPEPIFTAGPTGQLEGVGSATWQSHLITTLRLQANFGRHFWPYQLMMRGVGQLDTDVVMRHQLDGLRQSGSNTARSRAATLERLKRAMNEVFGGLGLQLPKEFDRD